MNGKHIISIEIDDTALRNYSDSWLAMAWHVAQANPVPYGDHEAGELVEHIGREIIRRWLGEVDPELWHHQGRDHYWSALTKFAKYEPGGPGGTPEWSQGRWVAKPDVDQADAGEPPQSPPQQRDGSEP